MKAERKFKELWILIWREQNILCLNILDYLEIEKKTPRQAARDSPGSDDSLQEDYLETMLQTFPQHLPIVPDYLEISEKFGSKWDPPLLATLIRFYEEAIASTPKYADLHFQLGRIYDQMEDWDKAVKAFSEALEINPFL
jgi:tetratricopeptide (TPR) repeat protein